MHKINLTLYKTIKQSRKGNVAQKKILFWGIWYQITTSINKLKGENIVSEIEFYNKYYCEYILHLDYIIIY